MSVIEVEVHFWSGVLQGLADTAVEGEVFPRIMKVAAAVNHFGISFKDRNNELRDIGRVMLPVRIHCNYNICNIISVISAPRSAAVLNPVLRASTFPLLTP